MKLRERLRAQKAELAARFFGAGPDKRPPLCRLLWSLGSLMVPLGFAIFLTAPQWGVSDYDCTVRLDAPQPILSDTRLLAENGRLYVFIEELCAVNVYEESGEFLFCVRGQRCQNGKAQMFLSGTDICIVSRKHELFRFSEDGAWLGRQTFYETLPAAKREAESGGAVYSVRFNRIYRTSESGTSVFAQSPLYLYYIKSVWLGWLTAAAGMAFREVPERVWRRWKRRKNGRPSGGG